MNRIRKGGRNMARGEREFWVIKVGTKVGRGVNVVTGTGRVVFAFSSEDNANSAIRNGIALSEREEVKAVRACSFTFAWLLKTYSQRGVRHYSIDDSEPQNGSEFVDEFESAIPNWYVRFGSTEYPDMCRGDDLLIGRTVVKIYSSKERAAEEAAKRGRNDASPAQYKGTPRDYLEYCRSQGATRYQIDNGDEFPIGDFLEQYHP